MSDVFRILEGAVPYRDDDAAVYLRQGWWSGLTLADRLDQAADAFPDKVAFIDLRSRLTYGQARERAERLALGLLEAGVRPLERVLVQLPNWNEFVPAYFALQKIGAIPVMLIDRYRQHEVEMLAALTEATTWIVPLRHGKVDFVPIIRDVVAAQPQIQRVITVRDESNEDSNRSDDDPGGGPADPGPAESGQTVAGQSQRGPRFIGLERLITEHPLAAADQARLAALRPDPMQVAHMGPTGGTTGTPKIVPRTHNSLGCTVEYCSKAWGQDSDDVNLIVGSIGHDLSFTKGFLGSIITGGSIVLLDTTDMQTVCQAIEQERVTSVVWVPTLAQRLLQCADLDDHDLTSLRKMHSGGGAALPGLVRGVFERLGARFCNGYGATEGMTTITRPEDDVETVCTTVGLPTCPGDLYKAVDASGATLPPGMPGELLVKGPGVFTGYYRNTEENGRVFDGDGFFKTGDVVTISASGYVRITGRVKEMINRGGESISATVIEDLIQRHPDVALVAVVAMPDPVMGERACAYIQPKTGASLDFEKIIVFLREEKASVLQLPERIEFVDAMPFTAAQKVDKQRLQADIRERLAAEAPGGGAGAAATVAAVADADPRAADRDAGAEAPGSALAGE